jgi:hypothetical protein
MTNRAQAPVWAFRRPIGHNVNWKHLVNNKEYYLTDAIWRGTPDYCRVAESVTMWVAKATAKERAKGRVPF